MDERSVGLESTRMRRMRYLDRRNIEKEWQKVLLQEEKFLKGDRKKGIEGILGAKWIEEKVPDKLVATLYVTLKWVFHYMFEKGTTVIEKTIRGEKLKDEFEKTDVRVKGHQSKKALRGLEGRVSRKQAITSGVTMVEGAGLGLLGIGVPDIPVFTGVVLRGIYEVAASYGYDYNTEWERVFILRAICASLAEGEERFAKNRKVDQWLAEMKKDEMSYSLEEEIELASAALTEAILIGKFVQGFFVVGAVGGVLNVAVYNRILNYVSMKYKKRYLLAKRNE